MHFGRLAQGFATLAVSASASVLCIEFSVVAICARLLWSCVRGFSSSFKFFLKTDFCLQILLANEWHLSSFQILVVPSSFRRSTNRSKSYDFLSNFQSYNWRFIHILYNNKENNKIRKYIGHLRLERLIKRKVYLSLILFIRPGRFHSL